VSRLYLVQGGDEIARRRAFLTPGRVIEAWTDLFTPGLVWMGEESKALLDSAGEPVAVRLVVPAERVAVYYGPRLTDIESLPPEESLKARVLSAHGIAAAWITLDRFGHRTASEPTAPADPVFHLRRRGGGAGHRWRLFRAKPEAVVFMGETYGKESEAVEWAQALEAADFDALVKSEGPRPS
jgi:hypothetical protein